MGLESTAYFSLDPAANPLLHNFSKVYVRYCDGGYYSTDRKDPVPTHDGKGGVLHMKGSAITAALFADLSSRHNLDAATDIVVAGCSAGAIHVFGHLDHLRRAHLPSTARVVGFPDSGFYMDLDIFTPLKSFVVREDGGNATQMLAPWCLAAYQSQQEKCLIGSVVAAKLETPLFAWQSEYDHDQRGCEMTAACAKSAACINAYGVRPAVVTSAPQLHRNCPRTVLCCCCSAAAVLCCAVLCFSLSSCVFVCPLCFYVNKLRRRLMSWLSMPTLLQFINARCRGIPI